MTSAIIDSQRRHYNTAYRYTRIVSLSFEMIGLIFVVSVDDFFCSLKIEGVGLKVDLGDDLVAIADTAEYPS